MRARRTPSAALVGLGVALLQVAHAHADDDDVTVTDSDDEDSEAPAKPAKKGKKAAGDDAVPFRKQDLNGHDLGTSKKENFFERDRFFVDKTDTDATEKGTLVQGSLTSSSFAYRESGDTIAPVEAGVPSASQYSRVFTDLRLQTDFRHIAASRWDARIDVRGRAVVNPGASTPSAVFVSASPSRSQSGLLGENELEIKELWLVRNGVRSDLFFGRQFVPDLGGLRIDGLRVDYASSSKLTYLGFGGLYPIRGSRSITSDYQPLQSDPDINGDRKAAGRFTAAGGFGAAYRTLDAYGSFGGVVIAPLSSETPRVYATSTGYLRYGTQLDFYHLVILDLVGSNTANAGLTNVSLGINYKPDQRLRATVALHRVDTETLNVQAQAFLTNPEPNVNIVQNEAYVQRIATNSARASLSAGLGELQRFELTAAGTFRHRGELTLTAPTQTAGAPMTTTLPAAQSAEIYGAFIDRRSVASLRLGVDGSRTFAVGGAAFQRTSSLALRAFAGRALADGHGEWEAELGYTTTKDDNAGKICTSADLLTCFGSTNSSALSLGGNIYYRINRDWFVMGSAYLNRISISHLEMDTVVDDPAVLGMSGYFRAALRF